MFLNGCLFLAVMTTTLPQAAPPSAGKVAISFDDAQELGNRIWKNECAGKIEGLTSWNEGEDFASLGIGHFLWYPNTTKKKNYQETFPDMLAFMVSCGASPPSWIDVKKGCPWRNKNQFVKNIDSPKMNELRQFLYDTRALQAIYIAKRLEEALPKITKGLELTEKKRVEKYFHALSQTPKGVYALVDYLNFKGEGTSTQERYGGKGWGLKQVLVGMPLQSIRYLDDFVVSAKAVLAERVKNAPTGKNENRWLKGWNARLNTYLL